MPRIEPFEKYSEKYEDWFERNEFVYKSEIQAIKELLPKVKKGIEIGVGSGRFAVPLGIKTGVDPSPRMREIAQQKGVKVIDAVAEELPFENSQFELVLMVTTICFVDNLNLAKNVFYKVATFYSVKEVVYNLNKVGFKKFNFKQTIFHSLNEIKNVEPVKENYGQGSFVVIRARK